MIRELHGGILQKVLFARLIACKFHGLAVQQERFSGRGHEFYEPFPNPDVPTPECVQWLLTTSGFLMNVMLFTNIGLLLSLLPCLFAMYRSVRSFPNF